MNIQTDLLGKHCFLLAEKRKVMNPHRHTIRAVAALRETAGSVSAEELYVTIASEYGDLMVVKMSEVVLEMPRSW